MTPLLLDLEPADYPLEGQPAYRRTQIARWIYQRGAASFADMTDLPAGLRQDLAARFDLQPLALVQTQGAADTTRKLLWRLRDGELIESVLIPASPALYGSPSDRLTLCVSTQVGCAYGCRFCASGLDGFKRNLSPGEIVGQATEAARLAGRRVDNLVFMGMGEPLANYDALMRAIRILNAPWGPAIGARRITVSTSGLAPRIRDLAQQPLQIRLAVSLHGATDDVREKIMPVNRRHPLPELLDACAEYLHFKGRMITFEFILIEGVNDSLDQAARLAALAKRLHAKANLIPYNSVEGLPWRRPSDNVVRAFAAALRKNGVAATVRLEKGHDIDAACGQLRLKTERTPDAKVKDLPPGLAESSESREARV